VQNSGKYLHGGAITTLVDVIGAAAIPAAGFPWESGVSVEINASCLDAAYVNVRIYLSYVVLKECMFISIKDDQLTMTNHRYFNLSTIWLKI
jgi:hypothetical protein